ncbi:1536_t:CDS:2 [Scutellospora calospora]|uniref:1536_t:CDS:1 n=1 Tax=Scutellospora calospora TaxID=85575 RepID=A0ACA9JUK9_9GLOM|nr:1536_t:CDS:2 [Scutellospora calospora]
MSDNEIISAKCKNNAKKTVLKKLQKILSGKQKKELCQLAQNNPNFTHQELAKKFEIGQSTCYYHKLLLQNRIAVFDETNLTNELPDPVTIYDAIQFVVQAWNNVSENTIIHLWQKTGIIPLIEIDKYLNTEVSAKINNDNEETELENLISQF